MGFSYVRMVGQWLNPDGSPATGYVAVTPSQPLVNDGQTIDGPVRVPFSPATGGAVSFLLAATNDPDTLPATATYDFFVYVGGTMVERYHTAIPHTVTQLDITVDLPWAGSTGLLPPPVVEVQVSLLSNGWGPVIGYPMPGYLQGDDHVVHLAGALSGGTPGATAFTLPAGMSPGGYSLGLSAACLDGTTGVLRIDPDGSVRPMEAAGYQLNGLSFLPLLSPVSG